MSVTNTPHQDIGVEVITTARLHMGFFDLHGGLGRRFGSIGLSLDKPATHLQAYPADDFVIEGIANTRALNLAKKIAAAKQIKSGLRIRLLSSIAEHAGLGSGTQMALAVGMAMSRIYNLDLNVREIAAIASRGARSGIGLGTFSSGGFVLDGGRASDTIVPPVIARAEFPEAWRVLLMFDHHDQGVHGDQEIEAFRQLPTFPESLSAELCRYVLMQALPALAEQDLPAFGKAIQALQVATGDYFSPVQGGRYASPRVASALGWLETQGVVCFGQSSWGPTGFAIFADESEAMQILDRLQTSDAAVGLELLVCKGLNQGGVVREIGYTA